MIWRSLRSAVKPEAERRNRTAYCGPRQVAPCENSKFGGLGPTGGVRDTCCGCGSWVACDSNHVLKCASARRVTFFADFRMDGLRTFPNRKFIRNQYFFDEINFRQNATSGINVSMFYHEKTSKTNYWIVRFDNKLIDNSKKWRHTCVKTMETPCKT